MFLAPSGAQEVTMLVRSSVRSVQTCLELSIFIFLSQVFLRSVPGQSQVSLRSVPGQSQDSLRTVSGQSQVSLRSPLGLPELTSSRRSLKYFVLLLIL